MNSRHYSQQQQHLPSAVPSRQLSLGEKQPSWRSGAPEPVVRNGSAVSYSSKSSVKSFTKYPSQLSDTEAPPRTPSKKLSSSRRSHLSRQSSSRSLPEEQGTTLPIERRWAPQMTDEGKYCFMKETVVRRSENLYTMDLQLKKNTQPMFAAEKDGQSSYIFRSIISNTVPNEHPVMGTLTIEKTKRRISKVYNNQPTNFVIMHHDRSRAPYKTATIQYDEKSLYEALRQSHRQQPQHIVYECVDKGVFESKDPHQSESGGYALDFRGRGRESSRKNVQLQKEDGTVILQMVRWGKDEFHVDYQDPIDGFHAFAFALAQFERFSNRRKSKGDNHNNNNPVSK
jgi:Tub family